jgi:hypothetical protein
MIQATVACAVKHFTAVIYSLGHGLRFYSRALKGLKASMDIRKYSCDNLKKNLRYPQLRKVSLNNFSQQGLSGLNNRRKLIR